jgi:fructokinase
MKPSLFCMGEVLWDMLPDSRFLGGAPLNVAAHAVRAGAEAAVFSAVGADDLGREAITAARGHGVETTHLTVHPAQPTGQAIATLGPDGNASYRFNHPCGWDALQATPAALAAAAAADVVVHGTLARRSAASRTALDALVQVARAHVYDPNLRPPHDEAAVALAALPGAWLVKLNEAEAARFCGWLGLPGNDAALATHLGNRLGVQRLCITRGGAGATLWADGVEYRGAAVPVHVLDTVGAGDSFLAMLTVSLLQGLPAQTALERALRIGALVAARPGAIPDYPREEFTG